MRMINKESIEYHSFNEQHIEEINHFLNENNQCLENENENLNLNLVSTDHSVILFRLFFFFLFVHI